MNNLYVTLRGAVKVEDGVPAFIEPSRSAINSVYLLKEDTHIVYDRSNKHYELDGKAGDILVTFYDTMFVVPMILVHSQEWADNITNYEDEEQKRKEEWAKGKAQSYNTESIC